ncbi:DUF6183 family protein [Kitasatospora sp. NPDC048407]|uniref:DUF6183 family protein n=1 Tax=Kitasatospora sp. NPDC048407 TaxID=3364051 RepID=UPI0037204B5D
MTDRRTHIARILAGLPDLTDVTGVSAMAEERLAQGDAAFLADLGLVLAASLDSPGATWQYRSVFDRLVRLLAVTPGAENVRQALRLLAAAPRNGRNGDRLAASLLASGHRPADLAAAFAGPASDELRACLVHELVLRGVDLSSIPRISAWATAPHFTHHPLGALPLTRSPLEAFAALPGYSAQGGCHALPYGSLDSEQLTTRRTAAALPPATETTTPELTAALGRAVANWAEESNGRIEARVFEFATPLPVESVPAALLTLGLDCLTDTKPSALSVSTCPPADAWRVLFAAASTGGAYNSGAHGAYGRLAAWQSAAALADTTLPTAEARATACHWFGFDAPTPWFHDIAWDFGLATLTPDGRRLAVLAATDTD